MVGVPRVRDVTSRTVLHLLPFDQPRGAQRYARTLVDQLASESDRHLIVTLFRSDSDVLNADIRLDVPIGAMRRAGLDPRALLRLRRSIADLRPSLVIAHGGEPAKYAALALPRGLPLVYLTIGSAHPRLERRVSSWLRRRYTERSDVVVTVSRALADEAVSMHGVPEEKIVVIPNGRDPAVYAPRTRQDGDRSTRLIWIGQLDETKRPEVFLELCATLAGEGLDLSSSIVGDGPRMEELAAAAERAGVAMLGHRDDVPELLAGSDLLVFTGGPPEGLPGVLIEAGMTGLAVVSTRLPGTAEAIEDGVSGVLVGVDDFTALVAGVRSLALDPDRRREMGTRARARCIDRFSIASTADSWRDLFAGLLPA